MKIWLVQFQASLSNKQANLEKKLDYAEKAVSAGVELVVFPELSLTGYVCHDKLRDLAEPVSGPSTRPLADFCQKEGLYVTFGMPELAGSYIYNSTPLFGPEGLAGVYRKLVLATAWTPQCIYEEGMFFKTGNDIVTFDTRMGKLGPMICKDLFYPEIARTHAVRGALLLFCQSAAPFSGPKAWFQPVGLARAIENVAWFGYVNLAGVEEAVHFTGGSFIANQRGEIIRSASSGEDAREEVLEVDIDLKAALKARLASTWLKEVRPDILRLASEAAARA